MRRLSFLIIILLFTSCSLNNFNGAGINKKETVCLVLSVGGLKGIAHFGAIDALRELDIEIDCIYGNSAGSLVGGMYAYNPKLNFYKDSKKILNNYIDKTKSETINKGIFNGLLSMLFTGGALGWENLFIGGLTSSVKKIDFSRFKEVLDEYFNLSNITDTQILYATSYTDISKGIITKSDGNLADAISKSCNNPFIFNEISNQFDPGADRLSSTPIEDAYNHFKPDKIIAINISQASSYYSKEINSKILEISIPLKHYDLTDKDVQNKINYIYNDYYASGFNSVMNYFNK